MKNLIFLCLAIFFAGTIQAQVTIGTDAESHSGAILDLQYSTDRGLLLPQVALTDVKIWGLNLANGQSAKPGMMVYNTSASMQNGLSGRGVYVWTGDDSNGEWKLVAGTNAAVLDNCATHGINVTGSLVQNVMAGSPMQTVTFTSNGAPIYVSGTCLGITVNPAGGGTNTVTISGSPQNTGVTTFTASTGSSSCATATHTLTLAASGVCTAPSIQSTSTLANTTTVGNKVTMSVAASGSDLTYTWYSGATQVATGSPSYAFNPIALGTTTFYCVVGSSCSGSSATSQTFTVNTVDITSIPAPTDLAKYYLSGTTAFDVAQTEGGLTCGDLSKRTNAFAGTKSFAYTLNGSPTNQSYMVLGAGSSLVKNIIGLGNTVMVTFVDNVETLVRGNQTGQTFTLYAMFTDAASSTRKVSLDITVKDCQTCGRNGNTGILNVGINSYLTHEYATGASGALQCWMVSNSKEGTYSARYYRNNSANGDNGAYYTYTDAATACPTGWRIPYTSELASLKGIVNANLAATQAKWWVTTAGGAFAGYANFNGSTWYAQGVNGHWWSSTSASRYFDAVPGGMGGEFSDGTSYWFNVRCVQN